MTARTVHVIHTTEYAKKVLSGNTYGTVHSVYRKTVNLQLDGQLLSLQAKDSPLSPISLITDLTAEEMEDLKLMSGMPAVILRSPFSEKERAVLSVNPDTTDLSVFCIQLEKHLIFSLESADFSDLLLSRSLSAESLQNLECLCLKALRLRSTGSFELLFTDRKKTLDIPFLKVADMRLTAAETALTAQNWNEAADSLRRLIGLGLGLTPGGDDFLCGVLAGLILCGKTKSPFACALSAQIRGHLTDTNDISAAFLLCALDGEFSQAVNSLPKADNARQISGAFSEIGHSSGTDTLSGVYYLFKNRFCF